jgi:hypothetical protein
MTDEVDKANEFLLELEALLIKHKSLGVVQLASLLGRYADSITRKSMDLMIREKMRRKRRLHGVRF